MAGQTNFRERKIREFKFLREDAIAIAILAGKRRGAIRTYRQLPELERFGRDFLLGQLDERDFIDEPVNAAILSDKLDSFGIENLAIEIMSEPSFSAGKLSEIGFLIQKPALCE